mmetsp:Transcript_7175/g.14383  ORF Transcript_7175/g.14383 Transcript_7175/m.14383 type:complete len:82 (-) Transcript_7175:21-266(-)
MIARSKLRCTSTELSAAHLRTTAGTERSAELGSASSKRSAAEMASQPPHWQTIVSDDDKHEEGSQGLDHTTIRNANPCVQY